MNIEIKLPTALRAFADKQEKISVNGDSVGDALEKLFTTHPRLRQQLMSPEGKLRSFVNVYVNEDDVRDQQDMATVIKNGDTIIVVPAIAGGR